MIFKRCFRTIGESLIHPMAGAAFLSTEEPYALHLELDADERVEVHTLGDDIAAKG